MRQIKLLKNHALNNYGHILVKYYDSTLQSERSLKFKISESKIKVKHILIQAYQIFKQKKCDVSQYCLIQLSNKDSKVILPNNTLIADLISPYKIEDFMIVKTQQYLSSSCQEKDDTNSTCSPIRIMRSDMDNSLERLISSPAQTIYIQPNDENDEVIQLNQSCSESQMQLNTHRQHNRNNSKSSNKLSQKSNSKLNRKSKVSQQQVYQQNNNKDQGVNSSTSNYLQNYITSNRQSHKKQPSSSSNIIPITHFQVKKHSVNDTAFNYNGQMTINQLQSNTGSTSTNSNTGGINSLSRGNSMKKMKTFCNGSTGSNPTQTSIVNSNNKPGSSLGQTSSNNNTQVSGFNKQNKKIMHKNGKSVNMYSTLNGQSQPQNALKKSQPKEVPRDNIKETFKDNAFVKIIQEDYNQTTRNEKTPAQSRQNVRETLVQSNQSKAHGSMKQSFASNQDQALLFQKQHSSQQQHQTQQERPQINNLNEIFSDFLDEQSQIQSSSHSKGKVQAKVRAESLHSRQQVLLEEDSLENMKKMPVDNYNNIYLQTEQYNSGLQDSQTMSGSQATQRAIKHMAHKSMYALNSNQSRLGNQKKSLGGNNSQSGKNQNGQGQHFGTFDNSQAFYNHQYAITTMSDCNIFDNIVLTENHNICNINLNADANRNDNLKPSSKQQHSLRMNTEIDLNNKENINNQKDQFDGLGKRGGTMGYTGGNIRSDSNPTKHRNNRYSDQQDDLMMLDMSEEDSVLMKQRF